MYTYFCREIFVFCAKNIFIRCKFKAQRTFFWISPYPFKPVLVHVQINFRETGVLHSLWHLDKYLISEYLKSIPYLHNFLNSFQNFAIIKFNDKVTYVRLYPRTHKSNYLTPLTRFNEFFDMFLSHIPLLLCNTQLSHTHIIAICLISQE